jgi:hypothetical protein
MELEDLEKFFNHKFDYPVRLYDGLYHPDINKYFVYNDNLTNNSYYIIILPYNYYMIFPFMKETLKLLKKTTLRYDGISQILDIYNNPLYDEYK